MEHTELNTTEHSAEIQHHGAGHEAVPYYQDATFWVALSIVVFVVLVFGIARKMFVKTTDQYAQGVAKQLQEAKDLKAQAEKLLAEYRGKQKQGQQEAEAIIAQAKKDGELLREESSRALKDLIRQREQQAMDKIARMEADIIKELRIKTANMAIEATQQILGEILDAQRNALMIDQAIKEMPKQLH